MGEAASSDTQGETMVKRMCALLATAAAISAVTPAAAGAAGASSSAPCSAVLLIPLC